MKKMIPAAVIVLSSALSVGAAAQTASVTLQDMMQAVHDHRAMCDVSGACTSTEIPRILEERTMVYVARHQDVMIGGTLMTAEEGLLRKLGAAVSSDEHIKSISLSVPVGYAVMKDKIAETVDAYPRLAGIDLDVVESESLEKILVLRAQMETHNPYHSGI